jgi:hypothetical protein
VSRLQLIKHKLSDDVVALDALSCAKHATFCGRLRWQEVDVSDTAPGLKVETMYFHGWQGRDGQFERGGFDYNHRPLPALQLARELYRYLYEEEALQHDSHKCQKCVTPACIATGTCSYSVVL